jgi:hypothetical protein
MALLAQIAKTQKVAVLLTSQVRSIFNYTYVGVEPVATRVLKFWADTIISMKPTGNTGIIQAVLEKTPVKAKLDQLPAWYLKIDDTGIHEHSTS